MLYVKVLLCVAQEVMLFTSGGRGFRALRSATREVSPFANGDKGYSPLTSPTFLSKKSRQKNLNI